MVQAEIIEKYVVVFPAHVLFGALAKVLKALADGDISIEYLYSYSRTGGNAIILFKVKEVGRALDVLSRADVRVLDKAL